jgi:two-component system, OmpR family, sensor histidine kinase VicK
MTQNYSLRTIKDIGKISSDGILVYHLLEERTVYCNKALARIFGVRRDEMQSMDVLGIRKLVKDDDEYLRSIVEQVISKAAVTNIELRVNGDEEKYISCDAFLIGKASLLVAFIKDITLTKQHATYISEFGARKDAILDMVSHNLSGPLNLTNNLLDLVDQLNKQQQYKTVDNHTRLIRENTQHCIDIINSFLREEHLASEGIFVESNRYDVIAKVKVVVERLAKFHADKRFEIVGPDELFVTGDDVKFFQVVHNLLSNAIKFTKTNGRVTIEVRDNGHQFVTTVRDNGIGIPDFLQPHIFKKNTPAGRPGLRGEKSIGMGLYIVKKLVDLMKGQLSFESKEGEGTTFHVTLPKSLPPR